MCVCVCCIVCLCLCLIHRNITESDKKVKKSEKRKQERENEKNKNKNKNEKINEILFESKNNKNKKNGDFAKKMEKARDPRIITRKLMKKYPEMKDALITKQGIKIESITDNIQNASLFLNKLMQIQPQIKSDIAELQKHIVLFYFILFCFTFFIFVFCFCFLFCVVFVFFVLFCVCFLFVMCVFFVLTSVCVTPDFWKVRGYTEKYAKKKNARAMHVGT